MLAVIVSLAFLAGEPPPLIKPRADAPKEGFVEIRCKVAYDPLGVRDCFVLSETPLNFGFGSAALHLMKTYELKPTAKLLRERPAFVTIPIRFGADPPLPDTQPAHPPLR